MIAIVSMREQNKGLYCLFDKSGLIVYEFDRISPSLDHYRIYDGY